MSPTCEDFIKGVFNRDWGRAFLNLNGLNMFEMLRGIAALDPLDRKDLWDQEAGFTTAVDIPRIEYARNVVETRTLPAVAPGDLASTGQVGDAGNFIGHPTPLIFEHDLTGTFTAAASASPPLSEADFLGAAATIGAEVSAVKAVAEVEAGHKAFGPDGFPIIRYELHIFSGKTNGTYNHTHPHLSQPTRAAGARFHDNSQATEWGHLYGAMILRESAAGPHRIRPALWSTSWGMFQVMGFNYDKCGWGDVLDFVRDMFISESNQLRAFVGYVQGTGLGPALIRKDWSTFANGYNGPSYRENNYDVNMSVAFNRIHADRVRRGLQA
jgi:N-acetylmuramidase